MMNGLRHSGWPCEHPTNLNDLSRLAALRSFGGSFAPPFGRQGPFYCQHIYARPTVEKACEPGGDMFPILM